jgi:dTMP kinase
MKRGIFISFEGSEGCGKSTQITLLKNVLTESGCEVMVTREPGGTFIGEKIRDLLQFTPEAVSMRDETELLLFAASRAQLVREVIRPALDRGIWVIADRFLDSTTVYQGIGRGLNSKDVENINRLAVGETMPDWTVLLDLDAATGHQRAIQSRNGQIDRIEDQPLLFFEKVREGYLQSAREHPDRIQVFDASISIAALSRSIHEACFSRFDWLPNK